MSCCGAAAQGMERVWIWKKSGHSPMEFKGGAAQSEAQSQLDREGGRIEQVYRRKK